LLHRLLLCNVFLATQGQIEKVIKWVHPQITQSIYAQQDEENHFEDEENSGRNASKSIHLQDWNMHVLTQDPSRSQQHYQEQRQQKYAMYLNHQLLMEDTLSVIKDATNLTIALKPYP
jgi:hypothetical protein